MWDFILSRRIHLFTLNSVDKSPRHDVWSHLNLFHVLSLQKAVEESRLGVSAFPTHSSQQEPVEVDPDSTLSTPDCCLRGRMYRQAMMLPNLNIKSFTTKVRKGVAGRLRCLQLLETDCIISHHKYCLVNSKCKEKSETASGHFHK